jgi:phage tail protein X
MIEYVTKQGDMLDAICFKYYKSTDFTEQVLEYNYGLASYGVILPAGITIKLPDIEKPAKQRKVKLW